MWIWRILRALMTLAITRAMWFPYVVIISRTDSLIKKIARGRINSKSSRWGQNTSRSQMKAAGNRSDHESGSVKWGSWWWRSWMWSGYAVKWMPIPRVKQVQDLKECRSILSFLIAASANGTSPEADSAVPGYPEGWSPKKRAMELIFLEWVVYWYYMSYNSSEPLAVLIDGDTKSLYNSGYEYLRWR